MRPTTSLFQRRVIIGRKTFPTTPYSISSKEFYDIYKQWCEDNACHSVSAIRFSAELRQNDRRYNLEATNNIYLPGGRRVRGFVGIEPLVHPCP